MGRPISDRMSYRNHYSVVAKPLVINILTSNVSTYHYLVMTSPKYFSLLEFVVLEELGNKHINKQTDSLTDWCFDITLVTLPLHIVVSVRHPITY